MNKRAMDKGNLLYSSPKCPNRCKILTQIYWILFVSIFSIPALIMLFSIPHNRFSFWWFITIFTILLAVFVFYMVPSALLLRLTLFLHFKIYSNGIEKQVEHATPFSKCNKIMATERDFPYGVPSFVKWKQMQCFTTGYSNQNTPSVFLKSTVIIYLNVMKIRKTVSSDEHKNPLVYSFNGRLGTLLMKKLTSHLKANNIPETKITCPKCKKKISWRRNTCQHCYSRRLLAP